MNTVKLPMAEVMARAAATIHVTNEQTGEVLAQANGEYFLSPDGQTVAFSLVTPGQMTPPADGEGKGEEQAAPKKRSRNK